MPTCLVECGDHSKAPGSIVCVHLLAGKSHEWCRLAVEADDESGGDWLCPQCLDQYTSKPTAKTLIKLARPCCIHCVRKLQAARGQAITHKLTVSITSFGDFDDNAAKAIVTKMIDVGYDILCLPNRPDPLYSQLRNATYEIE